MQDSLHGSAETEALSDSTPAVAKSDAVRNPPCERVQELNGSRCSEPAQRKDNALPPSSQVCTMSESSSTEYNQQLHDDVYHNDKCFCAHDELHIRAGCVYGVLCANHGNRLIAVDPTDSVLRYRPAFLKFADCLYWMHAVCCTDVCLHRWQLPLSNRAVSAHCQTTRLLPV